MKLGIDFGTCYSSAALLLDGTLNPIKEPLNHGYSFPSSVFISEQGEILVGQSAENAKAKNLPNYRHEFKRDLGSPDPYTLVTIQMLPEELVTEVLKKLKIEADKVTIGRGEKLLTEVILTVPATYQPYKRRLMQEAATKAGFSQIELLEEPVPSLRQFITPATHQ
jgi:molecular chaperone DnaK (HSP70)